MGKNSSTKAENYYNRELSWLLFDERVLGEARDKSNLLLERLKFLSITASNLDEFYMVRVASLIDLMHAGYGKKDIAGMSPKQQLDAISKGAHDLVSLQYSTFNRSLLPQLETEGIRLLTSYKQLTEEQAKFVDDYFEEEVYPVLTPMAVDSSRPFPLVRNKSLNIGALMEKKDGDGETDFALVQVPSVLPRIIVIPGEEEGKTLILLEEIIRKNLNMLFLNYDIICEHSFRVMRNADLSIDEDEAADLLVEVEKQIKKRQWGEVIRLELEDGTDPRLEKRLKKEFDIDETGIYRISGPIDLTFLMKMYGISGFDHLRNPKHIPMPNPMLNSDESIFKQIRHKDILLHHPYETFEPVINFISRAADDPGVLAIKQTLYRVSGNSPIVAALARAAENGKQVTVLVELKARFDEENNIGWARKLEEAGCHVIYGLVGLKTHCKITLVVRREEDGIRRYVHLGTGNYNDATAKLYTDIGLLTCEESIGEDATAVFNMLSGYSEPRSWNELSLAPYWLKKKFLHLIHRERDNALAGNAAHIIAKVNSLCDPDIIEALYEASGAGVKIELIVRGICCLRVGVKGVSENISVRSIVGDFLEHSRVFYFENAGSHEIYCGSADWMPRNLERRVEILFPIMDENLKKRVYGILETLLADTVKARILNSDGTYDRVDKRGKELICAQETFVREAKVAVKQMEDDTVKERIFIPMES